MTAVSTALLEEETVVTEKLDGGNCCLHNGEVYARTHSAPTNNAWFSRTKMKLSSFSWVECLKQLKIFGENMEVCMRERVCVREPKRQRTKETY